MPDDLADAITSSVAGLGDVDLVVRSSAPGEDGGDTSFAGLHESIVGVRGRAALLDAVRSVRSSLWFDAALLYRRELGLACVNGIPGILDRVRDGDRLTVDGFLGIVAVGRADFALELGAPPEAEAR